MKALLTRAAHSTIVTYAILSLSLTRVTVLKNFSIATGSTQSSRNMSTSASTAFTRCQRSLITHNREVRVEQESLIVGNR